MGQIKINYLLLLLVWIILAVIFGIYDLEISRQIVNQNSGWAKFLQDYGMIPGLLVILSGIFIYYSHIKTQADFWSYLKQIFFFLVSAGLIFYLFDIFFENYTSSYFLLFAILSAVISLIIFIFIKKKQEVTNTIAIKFAKVVVEVALFGYVICIQVVKYFWGRVRFRELDSAFSQFTPWYLPQGITGFDSFPSGHAAMGWILLPILILFSNKKVWIKNLVFIFIFFWAVALALSRVVIGAHYASDVLFGSFFIIMTFLMFSKNRFDNARS